MYAISLTERSPIIHEPIYSPDFELESVLAFDLFPRMLLLEDSFLPSFRLYDFISYLSFYPLFCHLLFCHQILSRTFSGSHCLCSLSCVVVSLSDLKSVSYQPVPLNLKLGADTNFSSLFTPHSGHFLKRWIADFL